VLPAANRLRSAADFRETTRRGTKAARGCVVVYLNRRDLNRLDLNKRDLNQRDASTPPVVGVIVSKSLGGSVQRHRAARRIRAAVRPFLEALPAGSTTVVRALPGADRERALAADVAVALQTLLNTARR
jgi:ribonuclease P protein component